jgi:outer membrane lipoprotein-sorting protein
MKIGRREALCGAAALLVASEARADDVDDALEEIRKARKAITTLKATFKQTRTIGLMAADVHSTGKMWLVRPDRLRWELDPPDAVTYWIGPEGIAVKSGDGVTKIGKSAAGKFAAVLEDLMILLGGDLAKLKKRYDLSIERPEGKLAVSARPRDPELKKQLALLRLTAEASLWRIERVEIQEPSGDKSLIAFTTFVKNEPIDPALMKPPK